jgi:ribose transport system substrate-binding protein
MPATIWAARLGPFKPKPGARLYLVNCLVSEGCTNFEASVKAAAAKIGYHVDVCSGSTAVQISACFQSGVNAKPNAILCTGCSNLANGPDFAKVKAAGIPLITAFSGDNPPSAAVSTDVAGGTHTYDAGVQLANGVIAQSNGKAQVIFFTDKEYASEIATTQGFNATIKKCITCSVKYITYSVATMQTGLPTQALAVIQQNPNINWYAGPNDGVPAAVAQAIRQSGKSGLHTASVYGYTPNLQLVRTGQQAFDIMHSHAEWGWAAVDAAARVFSGLKVPNTEDVTVVNYTQQNAATIGPFYNGPPNYQAQFEKLWGK